MNIGDLVVSDNSGKIGIVVGVDNSTKGDHWFVMMHDTTYIIHKKRLTKLGEQNEQSNQTNNRHFR